MGIVQGGDDEMTSLFGAAVKWDGLTLLDYMTIDDLLKLSCNENDAPLSAVLMCMFGAMNEGSVCLRIDELSLREDIGKFVDGDAAVSYAERFRESLDGGKYDGLITTDGAVYFPIVRRNNDVDDLLYFRKYFEYETSLARSIRHLLSVKSLDGETAESVDAIINEIVNERPVRMPSGRPMKMGNRQEDALRLALDRNFVIISGGPGRGKTSILINILRGLVKSGVRYDRIAISAPTGRAAYRVTESLQRGLMSIEDAGADELDLQNVSAGTIHRLLGFNPSRNSFTYHRGNTLPVDVIIVDEVSMVDIRLMDALLKAADPERTRFILLGDKDQLPSVEAGSILADMISYNTGGEGMEERVVILEEDYRSKGEIRSIANEINRCDCPGGIKWPAPVSISSAFGTAPGSLSIIAGSSVRDWKRVLNVWAEHFFCTEDASGESYVGLVKRLGGGEIDCLDSNVTREALDKIFVRLNNARILSLISDGIYGCSGINCCLTEYLCRRLDRYGEGQRFNGAPVMILRNDYGKDIFNGDTGVMFRDGNGVFRAVLSRSDNYFSFALDSMPAFESAFAMTVHKSQGSEFNNVMIALPERGGEQLLRREIIYTGITRANERVFVYGKEHVLNRAVNQKIRRVSGLVTDD